MSSVTKVVINLLVSSALKKKKKVREGVDCSGIFSTNPIYHII